MAACGGLEHIFEKPLSENSTFLESLSPWKQINSMKSTDDSSFTELFGELHFKENHAESSVSSSPLPQSSPSSSLSSNSTFSIDHTRSGIDIPIKDKNGFSNIHQEKNKSPISSYHPSGQNKYYRHSDSFSSMNSESLSLCTEGLGFESFDDVEDLLRNDIGNNEWQHQEERETVVTRNRATENHLSETKRSRINRGEFPPPISCIGRNGKPWVCFKSFREDGRFILKEIRIPTQEFLHACRENGRLRLQFIQSDDEIIEEDEEYVEENDEKDALDRNEEEDNVEISNCNLDGSS